MSVSVAIVGTDLAPLSKSAGALEMLCVGWSEFLASHGFDVYLFSIGPDPLRPVPDERFVTFADPDDLPGTLERYGIDIVIANNRPAWLLGNNRSRINIFHNYPDAWKTSTLDLADPLSGSGNLAVSAALAQTVNTAYPSSDTRVLYPFIDEAFFAHDTSDRVQSASKELRVLFPNRTLEKKGLRWLIATIDRYLCGQVHLTVVRNISPWTKETQEHAALLQICYSRPYVTVVDRVSDTQSLIQLYLRHDVVVAPSIRAEGLGLVPLEAQGLGVPVVTSDLGGLPESVFDPNQAVEAGNEEALASALIKVRKLETSNRSQLRQNIQSRFSLEASGSALASEILRLLDRHSFS